MSAGTSHKSVSAPFAVFHVDLTNARDALEAEEARTVRLSDADRTRFEQRTSTIGAADARRWRAAHIALRIALERATSCALRGVAFEIEAGGRPRIPHDASIANAPEFSLAHTDYDALIAIAANGPVGVDIEVPRHVTISDDRRSRIERAAQRVAPGAPLPDDPAARILQSWVRLEAVAKATGLGIGRVLTEAGIVGGQREAPASSGHTTDYRVVDLMTGPERYAAVAAQRLPQIVMVQEFPVTASALAAFLASRS